MENVQTVIAKDLLKIKAVFFRPWEPFTWASGIKSPVYCDNRLTLTAPEVRNDVENTSLTNFDHIAKVAAEEGYIQPEDIEKLIRFRNDPWDERWIGGNQ